jgi:hypothetical protein|mmetsp:Transcript_3058/g.5569  ORF Transcript_3058/g.5569 Transcript_3058/m.5569 type:complete len:105 (-) Transcript_3058:68-382(-)
MCDDCWSSGVRLSFVVALLAKLDLPRRLYTRVPDAGGENSREGGRCSEAGSMEDIMVGFTVDMGTDDDDNDDVDVVFAGVVVDVVGRTRVSDGSFGLVAVVAVD